jgi:hypothetical protein
LYQCHNSSIRSGKLFRAAPSLLHQLFYRLSISRWITE